MWIHRIHFNGTIIFHCVDKCTEIELVLLWWACKLFSSNTIFFLTFYFIYLAALGLHCCMESFSSCGEWGLLFVVVHGLLTAVASLVVEHGL